MFDQIGVSILHPSEDFNLEEVLSKAKASGKPHILVIWNLKDEHGNIPRYGNNKPKALLCFMVNDVDFAETFQEALDMNGIPDMMTGMVYQQPE